ncbi:nitrate- and nitrite sensing domain-containing protein [Streptomyces sp. JJ66]|uniref:sensor histidine kinase n=1 Tax=Streptomyces sp. JJ66 TaxID=2803843 RepID=UPI0027E23AC8|nr:nitrate- and nitrite sensing domain-containing protein [Streptomyces sp. JJ66]
MRRSKPDPPSPEERGNFTPPRTAAGPARTAHAAAGTPDGESGTSHKFAIRNWRVATRLNAILLIPVLVALVFGGFRVQSSIETLRDAQDAEATAELVRAAAAYGHALLDERDRTVAPLLAGDEDAREVEDARQATDAAQQAFDEAAQDAPKTPSLERRLKAIREAEPRLGPLRENAYGDESSGVQTHLGYTEVQHPLMNLANELGLGTENVTAYGRSVYAISLAKAAESLTRSIGTHLLVPQAPTGEEKQELVLNFSSYAYLEQIALTEYTNAATEEDVERLTSELGALRGQTDSSGSDGAPPSVDEMVQLIGSGAAPEELAERGVTPEVWYQTTTAKFDAYRGIEEDLANRALEESQQIAADARTEAIVNSVIVLAALLIAFVVAALMARSMSTAMNRLRTAAFDVAEQRLPMLVDQLSRTDPGRVDTEVTPIPIDSRDEIGEVARAFDQVHREAVRLAAEQALLRGNVNAIFTNLSSRNQGLIERQLGLITDLENNEADPDQLENLFKLDHLATRMRRNGENLLVLAGEEPGRRWNQPVPLVDVMRAASSEVEQYERIEISGVPESEIHGSVVTDLVHLLAELLENATSFSSPQTKVKVTATRLPDGRVMIEIHDKGIGLTAEDFADINHKLANPPTVDAAISQRMGLFVVGRLSLRHGIRVQLRPSGEQAGTTSLVMLPEAITHGGGGEAMMEDDFTVSRRMPEATNDQAAAYQGDSSAAALGFDDTRYGADVPDDLSSLDPAHRSLSRDARRSGPQQRQAAGHGDQQPGDADYGTNGGHPGADPYAQGGQNAYPHSDHPGDAYAQGAYQRGGCDQGGPYPQDGYAEQGYGQDAYDRPRFGESGYPDQDYPGQEFPDQGYAGRDFPGQDTAQQDYAGQDTAQQGYAAAGYDAEAYQQPADDGRQQYAAPDETQPMPRFPMPQQSHADGTQPGGAPAPGADQARTSPSAGGDREAFDPPGAAGTGALTGAGLPRRETGTGLPRREKRNQPAGDAQAPRQHQPSPVAPPLAPPPPPAAGPAAQRDPQPPTAAPEASSDPETGGWRSANDERWERAEQLRDPKAGGITSSGLPRRVPRANLVEGTAEQTDHQGPQVSRTPEDVRGRLSNLHRGVRRGRGATGGSPQNDRPGFHPGSSYEQER